MIPRPLRSLLTLALLALALPSCFLFALDALTNRTVWQAAIYPDVTYADAFDTALIQIEGELPIRTADRGTGEIESEWDFDSVSPLTRYMRRERVVAQVTALEEGIEVRLRVEAEVRERTGLLGPDDRTDVGWSEDMDDVERSERVFQRIHAILQPGRPSEDFYSRPIPER